MPYKNRDLSKTVFSLQPRCKEAYASLGIPRNKPFITKEETETPNRSEREATPHLVPSKMKITVQTDQIPREKSRGWTFGSDPELCDYLLDTDKSHGVSGVHFEVFHNWDSMVLIIKNLSRFQIKIDYGQTEVIHQRERRALCYTDHQLDVGLLVFNLEIPDRGTQQPLYAKNLEVYRSTVTGIILNLSSVDIRQRGNDTPAVKGLSTPSTRTSTAKYIRQERVGRGTTGTVYKGVDKVTGSIVALKEFRDGRLANKIATEINILSSVRHANITRYIEVVNLPEPLLVMEFISGGSLADLARITRRETLLMAQQISRAVSYLHDQDITHRDIKPANILVVSVGREFTCKLTDFGESTNSTIMMTMCGTLLYQAPELPGSLYQNSVDIWSLGIVLTQYWCDWFWHCVSGLPECIGDSWLPDTARSGVPGVSTFFQGKLQGLNWPPGLMDKWHGTIRKRLEEEQSCPMSQILFQMLETPDRRIKASVCRCRFEEIPLPEYS